ncbi:HipA N-terminal domain-containing protein [Sphingobacterium sp. DN00404]|uniref:HipA N-terminal domain-containing protein n=1 Tax=Sphingobacterium micropteri TaxID=2763501 RepID=A0ABR7YLV2_9SPHI|nr:HipA N-terminal domain-containing protein [Sphingobacterium micropteri]MBD1432315.1 HipA N-terminal domain-containing protein [Sphingobacterium micropteri]
MLKIFEKIIKAKKKTEPVITAIDKVFQLKYDRLLIGELSYDNQKWTFTYSEDFKKVQHKYNHIAGFSNVDKLYQSEELWPFFQSRIPGLKQPAVKEILIKEHIDANNKFELLKRFGKESIHNPYELELV